LINGKSYYQILGVLEDAEDIVIRAAFKVLAQKYHPDKFTGQASEADTRMSEINTAYQILSDPVKRKEYDESLSKSEYSSNQEDEEAFEGVPEDSWTEVASYFPDLHEITASLRQVSRSLETTYKFYLLERKLFEKRVEIADSFKKSYMERYFGTNDEILRFANFCIVKNKRDAARSLNRAVSLLGSDVKPERILNKIISEFFPKLASENGNLAYKILVSNDDSKWSVDDCIYFLGLNKFVVDTSGVISYTYTISQNGRVVFYNYSPSQLKVFTKKVASSVLEGIL